jgi:pilus assembly protein CpaE
VAELFNDLAALTLGRPETRRSGRTSLLEPLLARFAGTKLGGIKLVGGKAS